MKRPWRILIVDDHPTMRAGLRNILAQSQDCAVVGETGLAAEAVRLAQTLGPDLMIMDLLLEHRQSGLAIMADVRAVAPDMKVILFTNYFSDAYLAAALEAGINGYLLKDTPVEDVLNSVRVVLGGTSVFSGRVSAGMAQRILSAGTAGSFGPVELSAREMEVLQCLPEGMTNEDIAERLNLSRQSVQGYLTTIYGKLQARNRVEAVVLAARHGLISIDSPQ